MQNELLIAPVSVIVPCFNAHGHLRRAIDSILNQSFLPAQLILVDDASNDAGLTRKLIEKIGNSIRESGSGIEVISIFLEHNLGPGGARNRGWEIASQPWIAFLDADDVWHSNKIFFQYACIQAHPNLDLIAHKSSVFDVLKEQPKYSDCNNLTRVRLFDMLVKNRLPTRSVMLRRSIPLRFPEKILSEDYSLWLHIVAGGYDVRLVNCELAFSFKPEFSQGGVSGKLWAQERGELLALTSLYNVGAIGLLSFLMAYFWSLIRFTRRILLRKFFRLK